MGVSRSLSFDKLYSTLTKSAKKHGIVAWELTHSTLEEVFLNVVAQHQPAAAAGGSKKGVASDSSYEYESVYETASPSDSEESSQVSSQESSQDPSQVSSQVSSQDSSQVSSQDSFQDSSQESSQELTEGSGYDFNDTGYTDEEEEYDDRTSF